MLQGSLFVMPQNVQDCCELTVLRQVLSELGVLGGLMAGGHWYQAGDQFTQHIVYAGCSPHLRFAPMDADDVNFCHIALHGPFAECVIQTGENTTKPRCPACRGALSDWFERLQRGVTPCGHCGIGLHPCELDWHQQAAAGRVLLEARNVFPGEASPSDRLLNALNSATGFAWTYAWAGMRPFEI